MYNPELINMTMDEMVRTDGGTPYCFLAGAAAVGAVVSVATGNLLGAAVFGFALGYTGAGCIDS
jgi:hypothetical protein